MEEAYSLKNEANDLYQKGHINGAILLYTKAISLAASDSPDRALFLKNRAAAFLKNCDYAKAFEDCTAALAITPSDTKLIYRCAMALEGLGKFEDAYNMLKSSMKYDPDTRAIQPALVRLYNTVQERINFNSQIRNKAKHMNDILMSFKEKLHERQSAANNLVVIAREIDGSSIMTELGIIENIKSLLKVERNHDIVVNCIRVIGEICQSSIENTLKVIDSLGIHWFLDMLNCKKEDQIMATQTCMQAILNSFSGLQNKENSKPDKALCEQYHSEIDTLLTCLACSITNRVITGMARDAIMELLIRNIHYTTLNWAERLVEINGVERLLEVTSEIEEYKYESCMEVTQSSRTIAAVCLARTYENMYYDAAREKYMTHVDEFIKDKLLNPDIESKVRVTVSITSLLQGPMDVGNQVISKEGILEMILVMAGSEDKLQQRVACECIIATASKKDKAKAIIDQGVHILKRLYQSKDDSIRVRALVGLCKLGSSGGSDASIRPFADGATSKLAEACRKFLVNPGKDMDMRKWAAEGLSYLTLDADVKEMFVSDKQAIQALIELAKTGNQSVLYGVVTTLVNLCNAYDKQELVPELVELAKFAKHHIPEEHELDDIDFVNKRLSILANEGVTTALVALSKTESDNSKELIARVFNALCSQQDLRGIVVQQGGTKVLLAMSLKGTAYGKRQASQALARIGITINPETAFPGQRILEVIRPFLNLLHPDCTGLENFEALMALCNLASVNETVRQRILKEGGLTKVEAMLFEDHIMITRAATQVYKDSVLLFIRVYNIDVTIFVIYRS